jgi:hypothetical protein
MASCVASPGADQHGIAQLCEEAAVGAISTADSSPRRFSVAVWGKNVGLSSKKAEARREEEAALT